MLTHLDSLGRANMVDVSHKDITVREAVAQAKIYMLPKTLNMIIDNEHPKGDVLAIARIAGIQAAKKTHDLIPLCHPLLLTKVSVDIKIIENKGIHILTKCKLNGKTGVEMEALTAATIAALTVYDMCKAVDPSMVIRDTCLLEKIGGKSGHFIRDKKND